MEGTLLSLMMMTNKKASRREAGELSEPSDREESISSILPPDPENVFFFPHSSQSSWRDQGERGYASVFGAPV